MLRVSVGLLLFGLSIARPAEPSDLRPLQLGGNYGNFLGDDSLTLTNLNAENHHCYNKDDPLFFSLMSSHDFNAVSCKKELDAFVQAFTPYRKSDVTFWYTSNGVPPADLQQPAFQLPLLHRSASCSYAMVSTKLFDEFASQANFPWRSDWGPRTQGIEIERATVRGEWVTGDFSSVDTLCVAHTYGSPGDHAGYLRWGESDSKVLPERVSFGDTSIRLS